jgi:hypothetical protein
MRFGIPLSYANRRGRKMFFFEKRTQKLLHIGIRLGSRSTKLPMPTDKLFLLLSRYAFNRNSRQDRAVTS